MSQLDFAPSRALSLGIEIELQVVNTHDYDLSAQAEDLLRVMERHTIPGDVKPEITRSMIELSTDVCSGFGQALAQLREIRGALVASARELELDVCGGGTHPFQSWHHRRIYRTPRFHQVSELYGYLSKQFTIFGQHVHVGCPSADEALPLLHGLSRFVPHFIALAASSPFVQGVDTGFDSARLNSVFAFPLSGRAPFVSRWEEFETFFGKMTRTGVVSSMKDFYWDIRPKPEYGTVEVRVLDTPLSIEKSAALAGYIQCLARWLRAERPFELREDDYLPYTFNRFQACRFGLDATYVDPSSGEHRVLRDDIRETFRHIEAHAVELQAEEAILLLKQEIDNGGNDASWLRRLHESEASLGEVVRRQARCWSGD